MIYKINIYTICMYTPWPAKQSLVQLNTSAKTKKNIKKQPTTEIIEWHDEKPQDKSTATMQMIRWFLNVAITLKKDITGVHIYTTPNCE